MYCRMRYNMRFEALMAVKMSMLVFWVKPCGFVGRHERLGCTYCSHLQGVTAQKLRIDMRCKLIMNSDSGGLKWKR
jgi:hypothetical protein